MQKKTGHIWKCGHGLSIHVPLNQNIDKFVLQCDYSILLL